MPKLVIIRGLPGSGKSTLAKKIADEALCEPCCPETFVHHCETDHYWIRPDGTYDFNAKLLSEAHDWCFAKVVQYLTAGYTVVVSNTFTRYSEMRRYVELAKENGYELEVITLTENYGNIHNVPEATLEKMKARFESHEVIMEKVEQMKEAA